MCFEKRNKRQQMTSRQSEENDYVQGMQDISKECKTDEFDATYAELHKREQQSGDGAGKEYDTAFGDDKTISDIDKGYTLVNIGASANKSFEVSDIELDNKCNNDYAVVNKDEMSRESQELTEFSNILYERQHQQGKLDSEEEWRHGKERCLTRDQKESFKFDGRLIQLTEIQTESLGKSLDEKAIGEGAFGQVFRSKDSEMFGIPVAVKQIPTMTNARGKKHARMEMMANRLMNPFILPLIASTKTSNGDIWLITPYCENGDLEKAIKDGKDSKDKMEINMQRTRVRIALQIALAIQYIHTEVPNVRGSILHKDVASSNVVLDKNLNARLIDFGLAREKNDPSKTYSVKEGYIHPQKGHGDPIKESLDYFNFGIIILELLTSLGPLGEKQFHLRNMDNKQIQDKLDTKVWNDKEITKKLYEMSKKCLKEFKWTIGDFETNVIEQLLVRF
ncbi:uncharacterized protein LOC132741158 [Ruditapes philippinarum]|uniref:uncharacterized protein LOC132741158 n=1 Tax=Ruditapes philippinarum TaxID=129788 RepID=UPI00295A718C|nr:uncharacterized protein LOC132741158 [Ruditapes philippinarum]